MINHGLHDAAFGFLQLDDDCRSSSFYLLFLMLHQTVFSQLHFLCARQRADFVMQPTFPADYTMRGMAEDNGRTCQLDEELKDVTIPVTNRQVLFQSASLKGKVAGKIWTMSLAFFPYDGWGCFIPTEIRQYISMPYSSWVFYDRPQNSLRISLLSALITFFREFYQATMLVNSKKLSHENV